MQYEDVNIYSMNNFKDWYETAYLSHSFGSKCWRYYGTDSLPVLPIQSANYFI